MASISVWKAEFLEQSVQFLRTSHLEHLECGHQPHVQDRGAKKRHQLAGRSASGYGLESPSPGGARSQGKGCKVNTGLRGLVRFV